MPQQSHLLRLICYFWIMKIRDSSMVLEPYCMLLYFINVCHGYLLVYIYSFCIVMPWKFTGRNQFLSVWSTICSKSIGSFQNILRNSLGLQQFCLVGSFFLYCYSTSCSLLCCSSLCLINLPGRVLYFIIRVVLSRKENCFANSYC